MSLFAKAVSSSSFLRQGAQFSSPLANEELLLSLSAKCIPFASQKACFGLCEDIESTCRYHTQAPFAVGIVRSQSQAEAMSHESRQRGRPKKKPSDNGQALPNKSAELSVEESEQEASSVSQIREGHLFKYTEFVPKVDYLQLHGEQGVSARAVKHIAEVAKKSISRRGWFTIALSGGSLVNALKGLPNEPGIDWTKCHVFWVDERVVPLTDSDSNFKLAMGTFLSKAKIPEDQIHSIKYARDASVVAKKYDQVMRSLVKQGVLSLDSSGCFPQFDMILLGIGPDGHVASLFPNSLALAEEKKWVVPVLKSPKPPSQRISMTLPCINAASYVCFVVVGSSKAEIIQRVLERPALPGALPAQMVRPPNGMLTWFVDEAASRNLSVDAWGDPKKFPAVNFSAVSKKPQQ